MIKITHLFLGFLLVTGPVNAGVGFIKGAINWLTKSKTVTKIVIDDVPKQIIKKPIVGDATTHFPFMAPYQGSKLLRQCDKESLNSLENMYQEASKGITGAQREFVKEFPSYEKKCSNWLKKQTTNTEFKEYRRLYENLKFLKKINELRRKL